MFLIRDMETYLKESLPIKCSGLLVGETITMEKASCGPWRIKNALSPLDYLATLL